MPAIVNPFDQDAYSLVELTKAIEILPYAEGKLEQMNVFDEEGITQITVGVAEKDGVLTLIPNKQRGADATAHRHTKGRIIRFDAQHLPLEDEITSDDIQGKGTFDDPNSTAGLDAVMNNRLRQMKQSIRTTIEHLRIGAIKGTILDSDGATVIENLFTRFGVTQTAIDFVLGTPGTKIRTKASLVVAAIENVLGGLAYDHIEALCSPSFFRAFTTHTLVEAAFNRPNDGAFLRDDLRGGFPFGGIIWREYRGYAGGTSQTPFIPDGDCRFFPVGVPQLFQTKWCPGTFLEVANTVGIEMYAKQVLNELGTATKVHVQSSPFNICTRPAVLVRGHSSN